MIARGSIMGRGINLAPRKHRRWLVVSVYLGFVFWIAGWFSGRLPLALSGGIVGFVSLLVLIGVAGSGYEDGDEREIHRRDHAFFIAHKQLGAAPILLMLAMGFTGSESIKIFGNPAFQALAQRASYGLLFVFMILYSTLPQAILLWTEPDMEAQ